MSYVGDVFRNTKTALKLFGKPDIPVVMGSETPLVVKNWIFPKAVSSMACPELAAFCRPVRKRIGERQSRKMLPILL